MSDIFSEKKSNLSESILNSLYDTAIITTDTKGLIIQFNVGAEKILDFNRDDIVNKVHINKLFPESFIKGITNTINSKIIKTIDETEMFATLLDHPELVKEFRWIIIDSHKKSIDIKIDISPIQTGEKELTGVLLVIQDISEIKTLEKKLELARFQVEETSRTKNNFLANMSHEIRTPLNGILGMIDLLSDTDLSETQNKYSSIIMKSAKSLLLLVNDILDYSKIEAGKLNLEKIEFDLPTLMNDIKDVFLINIKQQDIEFKIDIDESIDSKLIGDPQRIKQILLNLIGNALKFTSKGFIHIEISKIREHKNETTLNFKIIDTGIGIESHKKDKLFKTFSQVDASTTRKYGGTGLGLAISKELVLMMNGDIGVISKKNEGSTFWFTIDIEKEVIDIPEKLPDAKPGQEIENEDIKLKNDKKDITILIAEDNKINQFVAMNFLKKLGYAADLVENGQEAIEALQKKEYSLIFMDHMMPVMDGIEATKIIRRSDSLKSSNKIKIIALTASAMKGDREKLISAGMDDYIAKPVLLKEMKRVLEKNLSND